MLLLGLLSWILVCRVSLLPLDLAIGSTMGAEWDYLRPVVGGTFGLQGS